MENLEKEKNNEMKANNLSKSRLQSDSSTIKDLQFKLQTLQSKESKEATKLNEVTKLE